MRLGDLDLLSRDELAARRRPLEERIRRKFQVTIEPHAVGPLRFDFMRVSDPNAVLDQICAEDDRRERAAGRRLKDDELHLPYWAELWDSAIGLAHFLVAHPARARGEVLDLGCGMGFAGTAAAAMGAAVTLADLETDCLLFAAYNVMPWPRCRARRVNWQRDELGDRFDTILGADVVYDRSQRPFLDAFWKRHLADGGRVVIAEPGRATGVEFIDFVGERGWTLIEHAQPIPTRERPIRVFELMLNANASNP